MTTEPSRAVNGANKALDRFRAASRAPALLLRERGARYVEGARRASSGRPVLASLALFVLLPTLLFFLYTALWQTRSYVAEARVTVRSAQEVRAQGADLASSILGRIGAGGRSTAQDSYIVLNYLKSASVINDLGGAATLEAFFSRNGIDYLSRLARGARIEDLQKYWNRRIAVSVDTVSGILTIQVEAYDPRESSELAERILGLSEKLLNDITLRNRRDALARNLREIEISTGKLAEARERLTDFRNRTAMIEPGSAAKSLNETITRLTLEKIEIEAALATLRDDVGEGSPTRRVQQSKLAAINNQIADLRAKLTNQGGGDRALSSEIGSYELLKLNEQFAERMYAIAHSSYERARQELEKQQLYLATIVKPATPQESTYPKIIPSTALLFGSLFVLWSIAALLIASVEEQMV